MTTSPPRRNVEGKRNVECILLRGRCGGRDSLMVGVGLVLIFRNQQVSFLLVGRSESLSLRYSARGSAFEWARGMERQARGEGLDLEKYPIVAAIRRFFDSGNLRKSGGLGVSSGEPINLSFWHSSKVVQ